MTTVHDQPLANSGLASWLRSAHAHALRPDLVWWPLHKPGGRRRIQSQSPHLATLVTQGLAAPNMGAAHIIPLPWYQTTNRRRSLRQTQHALEILRQSPRWSARNRYKSCGQTTVAAMAAGDLLRSQCELVRRPPSTLRPRK